MLSITLDGTLRKAGCFSSLFREALSDRLVTKLPTCFLAATLAALCRRPRLGM